MIRQADEYGPVSNTEIDNGEIINNIFELVTDLKELKRKIKDMNLGMNSFDFLLLLYYIKKNNIKKVTELGCGSTSQFLDELNIKRTSFAMSREGGNKDLDFVYCDIFEKKEEICEDLLTSDLLIIDSLHTYSMAEFYDKNIISLIKKPIFIHDFFIKGNTTFTEQKYWEDHILNKTYKLKILSNVFSSLNNEERFRPCAAIIEPIEHPNE